MRVIELMTQTQLLPSAVRGSIRDILKLVEKERVRLPRHQAAKKIQVSIATGASTLRRRRSGYSKITCPLPANHAVLPSTQQVLGLP